MTGIAEDLRYTLRGLIKNRGFALVAVVSLALGIGANTTVFTLLNAVLLQPLPVADPARLVAVATLDAHNPGVWPCSYPNYKDYRDRNGVFSSLLLANPVPISLSGRGDPQRLIGQLVSGNYFAGLGVNPVAGRGFLPEEDLSPGAAPVAVISYGLASRLFGGARPAVSSTVEFNGRSFRIVGVAPPGFLGVDSLYAADVWVPFMMYHEVYPFPTLVNQRRALLFTVVGRLKRGVSMAEAETAIQALSQDLAREYPSDNEGRRASLRPLAEAAIRPSTRPLIANAGIVLLTVSGLVVLIACANIANLLLARASGRNREMAVRLAMGASRGRLVRQLLTESMVLGMAGGGLGLLLALWLRTALWSARPPMFNHATFAPNLDGRVFGYDLAISLATGILFGLMPAVRSTRSNLATDLKDRTGQSPAGHGNWNVRSLLVAGQVAFSLVALLGAALFLRSVDNANRFDPGFDASRLGVIMFNVSDQGYDEARGSQFQRRALERAAAAPGVDGAAISNDSPFRVSFSRQVLLEGEPAANGSGRFSLNSVVGPGYLQTVRIALLRGRDFSPLDNRTTPRVAIVNEAAARLLWPDGDPVGKVIRFSGDNTPLEVVGLARNANYLGVGEAPQAMIYRSLTQYYFPAVVLYVHTAGDPESVAAAVRREIQALDRNLVLHSEGVRTSLHDELWAQRISAGLLGMFGCLALVLATIGIYGVVAYTVNQRVREFGVRMALGATPADIQAMILGEGVRVVAVGVILGLMAALVCSRLVGSMLLVTSPRDLLTFVLVPSIMALVAVIACWVPALRVTRIEPGAALREE